MEVSYRRHFDKSYMILKAETGPEDALELNILAYNKIPGFLPVETEIADGTIRFWYDITGKQTLGDLLKHKAVDYQLLRLIYQALNHIFQEMTQYLLKEEYLLLGEDYLYLDFERKRLEFVYFPDKHMEVRGSFQKLMEGLLQKLDHSNKQAVVVAYEMYQVSLHKEKLLSDMLKQVIETEEIPEIKEKEKKDNREENSRIWEIPKKERGWLKQRIYTKEKKNEEEALVIHERGVIYHPTEVLNVKQEEQGILKYQGEENQSDIRIDKSVFLIGKKEDEVDGYIGAKSVSRIHARVELSEGNYYLEDLNSTNGTYINGERLEYRQKVKLAAHDRISFGIQEYIFL